MLLRRVLPLTRRCSYTTRSPTQIHSMAVEPYFFDDERGNRGWAAAGAKSTMPISCYSRQRGKRGLLHDEGDNPGVTKTHIHPSGNETVSFAQLVLRVSSIRGCGHLAWRSLGALTAARRVCLSFVVDMGSMVGDIRQGAETVTCLQGPDNLRIAPV
jgi:hypothetical protein